MRVYELLKKAIEQNNAFMGKDMIQLQTEFFFVAGKISQEQYDELVALLNPPGPSSDVIPE
jgi:hypothetical protein